VEEPTLLLAVQRIVGRIEVENDLPRSGALCVIRHLHEASPPTVAGLTLRITRAPSLKRWRADCRKDARNS
jgi:hypothetical protein